MVLLNLDTTKDSDVDLTALTALLQQVKSAGPRAVAVDVTVASNAAPDRVRPLIAALSSSEWKKNNPNLRMAIPVKNTLLKESLVGKEWIIAAAPDLKAEDDGVIRRVSDTACTDADVDGKVTRPSFAQAVTGTLVPSSFGCYETNTNRRTILFGRERNNPDDSSHGILLLSALAVEAHPDWLKNAYVVIGHVGPGTDAFVTPVGLLSGARIHAAAIWSRAHDPGVMEGKSELLMFELEVAIWLILGAVSATYTTLLGHKANLGCVGQKGFPTVFGRFLIGIGGLLLIAITVQLIMLAWTSFAANMIEAGIFAGSVLPAFGALLEALVHAGRDIINLAEWISDRILPQKGHPNRRSTRSHVLLIAFAAASLLALPCAAEEAQSPCSSYLVRVQGALENVLIQPGSHPVIDLTKPMKLDPDSEIQVLDPGTTATVVQYFWGETRKKDIRGKDALLLLPCPPSRESWNGIWEAFWGAAHLHADASSREGTTLGRDVNDIVKPYLSGKLRELSNLAPATGVVLGAQGFAYAWAGGSPPYDVTARDGATGDMIKDGTSFSPDVWWQDWQVPDKPFVFIVRDAQGAELHWRLTLLPAPNDRERDLVDAVQLFQTAPVDRLEVLRRLHGPASGDPLSQQAVERMHVAGAGG